MWSVQVIVLLPFFQRLAGLTQCAKERFIQAFVPQHAVEAFDEAVLLELSRRDVVPINTIFLNPFKDRHAGELGAVIRCNRALICPSFCLSDSTQIWRSFRVSGQDERLV